MDSDQTHIVVRRRWAPGETVFLLGPGGVGKSTVGRELARQLDWPLIDLGLEFCERLEVIGPFIAAHGYERYRAENLALAERLVAAVPGPNVYVTSSGFLAARQDTGDCASARRIIATGYGIALLPSLDTELATSIVVARQLARGFGLERASEEQKFRLRFQLYREAGEMLVISTSAPAGIAGAVIDKMKP